MCIGKQFGLAKAKPNIGYVTVYFCLLKVGFSAICIVAWLYYYRTGGCMKETCGS